tara:strand:- start:22 stop:384 length:363 start_codon:yes stop_codon:yes gene_type:complete
MKDINLYVTCDSNKDEENGFFLTKLWNSLKGKSIKSRNKDKIQSSYNIKDDLVQSSDNESDKTNNEQNIRFREQNARKENSIKSNNSDKTKYHKRDKSLDIVRNKYDEYEIVLPYQRYIK